MRSLAAHRSRPLWHTLHHQAYKTSFAHHSFGSSIRVFSSGQALLNELSKKRQDALATLGFSPTTTNPSPSDIAKQYAKAQKEYHPDINKSKGLDTTEKAREINLANDFLKKTQKDWDLEQKAKTKREDDLRERLAAEQKAKLKKERDLREQKERDALAEEQAKKRKEKDLQEQLRIQKAWEKDWAVFRERALAEKEARLRQDELRRGRKTTRSEGKKTKKESSSKPEAKKPPIRSEEAGRRNKEQNKDDRPQRNIPHHQKQQATLDAEYQNVPNHVERTVKAGGRIRRYLIRSICLWGGIFTSVWIYTHFTLGVDEGIYTHFTSGVDEERSEKLKLLGNEHLDLLTKHKQTKGQHLYKRQAELENEIFQIERSLQLLGKDGEETIKESRRKGGILVKRGAY